MCSVTIAARMPGSGTCRRPASDFGSIAPRLVVPAPLDLDVRLAHVGDPEGAELAAAKAGVGGRRPQRSIFVRQHGK